MRKLFAVLAATLIVAWIANAAPLCETGTVASYVALGATGCQIDDKLFSNFVYVSSASGGAVAIPASGVSMVPQSTPLNPGFLFSAGWSTVAGQGQDSHISYVVTVLPGGVRINDVSAILNGFGATGEGLITVAENVDSCALGVNCDVADLLLSWSAQGGTSSATAFFSPTMGPLYVTKDIAASGGVEGVAAVSGVFNRFSEGVPEPLSLLLMGSGLLALGALRWRKKI